MAELRPNYIYIDVDLKKNTQYNVPVVTQNDTATHFIIRVTDDGLTDPELLDAYQEITMTSQRPDGESFYLTGTRIPGTNEIEFHLGTDETAFSGSVLASLQFYLVEDASRYTSAQFRYDVKKDLTKNYTPTQREETLVEVVLRDGPVAIQEAKDAKIAVDGALVDLEQDKTAAIGRLDEVTEENKTVFRQPVNTFADLATTYPSPEHGTTVRVTSEAATYRYSDGSWVKTDEYNPTAIDQVTAQLAETSTQVNGRVDNLILNQGDSTAEVTDSRFSNVDSTAYVTLPARLDYIEEKAIDKGRIRLATDFPNIQAAINDLPMAGGAVYVPPGVYQESIRITKPNVKLFGTWDSVIKTPDNAVTLENDAPIRIFADGVTIEGLKIDGNSVNNSQIDDFVLGRQADGIGIYANNCIIRNNHIINTIGHQIIVWNESFSGGLAVNQARRSIIIDGNIVEGGGQRAGIDIASTQNASSPGMVNNNILIVNNVLRDKVLVIHTAQDVLIQGNSVLNTAKDNQGISVHTASKRIQVLNNIIGPSSAGVNVANSDHVEVANNKIWDTSGTGITFINANFVSARGNRISETGSGASGIVYTNCHQVSIENNILNNIKASGVAQGSSAVCKNITIQGNSMYNLTSYGLNVVISEDLTYSNNIIDVAASGIVATNAASKRFQIQNNTFRNISNIAAHVYAENSVIQNNVWRSTLGDALRLGSIGARVSGNEFQNITGRGILLMNSPTGILIDNNRFTGVSSVKVDQIQPSTLVKNNVIDGVWKTDGIV